jgi:deferrochelatase/peroxidase EfeB
MGAAPVDFSNIQGLVRFGYARLTEASFLLLKIRDAAAARSWLAAAPVANAVEQAAPPTRALQIAFTRKGLQALGVPDDVLVQFSAEFYNGMASPESRSRRLGDTGANAPQQWEWGSQDSEPHVLLMMYAQEGELEAWIQSIQDARWQAAFELLKRLNTSDLQEREPFGFADGISQPAPDWKRLRDPQKDELAYGNRLALGEVLLGYPNEYRKYSQRPLVDPDHGARPLLPFAEDAPGKLDLARDGAFIVLRHLEQDVQGFWRFLDRQADANPAVREQLAECMVGRKMDGTPLVPSSGPIAGTHPKTAAKNQFTFDADAQAVLCPRGAHIRRANPRNADLPSSNGMFERLLHTFGFGNAQYSDDVVASTRFHRMIRRGREYGSKLTPEQAVADGDASGEHGIYFICIVANILRQFEFVQNAWIMRTKFDALTDESDPLLGNREAVAGCPATGSFTVQRKVGLPQRLFDLPQFVTVRGGAYFFLPGIRAIQYLAAGAYARQS